VLNNGVMIEASIIGCDHRFATRIAYADLLPRVKMGGSSLPHAGPLP